jgi:hypothetical protein
MIHCVMRMVVVIAGLIAPLAGSAQATELRGRVVNESGVGVAGATVMLAQIGYSVRSDSTGEFVLSGTPGSILNLTLHAPGYRSDSVSVTLPRRAGVAREFKLLSEASAAPEANPSDRLLRGRVIDTEGLSLSYASVQLNGGRRFIADDSGRFTMPSPSGQFSLIVRRIGFSPEEVKFEAAPDTAIRVRMKVLAASLPEQRITGRAAFVSLDLNGFYRRMRDHEKGINHGYFITPEDLELRKPNVITQMVEGLPGVYLRNRSARGGSMIVGSPCSELTPSCVPVGGGLYRCVMTVYLDGIRVVGRLAISPADIEKELVNELALPNTVAGMEVYPRGLGAPPAFQPMNGNCGVVLIWTK